MSFLAPSYNLEEREVNESRLKASNLISGINTVLQRYIQIKWVGFDDSFNINMEILFRRLDCHLLFEMGPSSRGLSKEETRKYVFMSLASSFLYLRKHIVDNRMTII
jgi:hypothetical protein